MFFHIKLKELYISMSVITTISLHENYQTFHSLFDVLLLIVQFEKFFDL